MENIKYTILVLYYNIYTIYTNFFLKNGEEFPLFVPRVISCDRNILRIHQHRIYNSSKSWDHNLFATIFFRVRKIFTFKFLYIYIKCIRNKYLPVCTLQFFFTFPSYFPSCTHATHSPTIPPPLPLLSSSPLLLALTYTMIDSFFSPYRTFSRSCIMHEFSRGSNLFFFFLSFILILSHFI